MSCDELVHDPLITYGNHSYRHYIPRSLDQDGQRERARRLRERAR